jgi:hypothetical protein
MNGAAPSPAPRRYPPRIAGHVKGSSRLRLKQPVIRKAGLFKRPDDFPNVLWVGLLVTLAVDCVGGLALAVGELLMSPTVLSTLGAAILLAIGIANGWAFNSVRRASSTWPRDAIIAQVLMLFLAGYVIVTDVRSPIWNWYVMATAVLVLAAAFLWFVLLAGRSTLEWTKGAVLVTALFPLAGFLQFWLQNYYMPSTTKPLVDVSTDLSPQGWTDSIIHLSAKVTLHNRGTTTVDVSNSVIRLTAYPFTIRADTQVGANPCALTADQDQDWCMRADALDPLGGSPDVEYPLSRTPPASSHLLYAGTYGAMGTFLVPGETDTFQREVDIDSKNVRLARLSFTALFLNERRIEDTRSCEGKHASENEEWAEFSSEVESAIAAGRAHYFCWEYDIAPANIIDQLIGCHPAMRVYTDLDNPYDPGEEYPRIRQVFRVAGRFHGFDPRLENKLEEVYPVEMDDTESEYASTDKPPQRPPSPAPAPPSGNG